MAYGSPKSVTIRGITYPSLSAASAALGVSVSSISASIKRGTQDRIGLGIGQKSDLDCDGVIFLDVRDLALAIGCTPASIYLALSRKRKDAEGYVRLRNHRIKKLSKPATPPDRKK